MPDPLISVFGHNEVYTDDTGLVSIWVDVHVEYLEQEPPVTTGHRLVFTEHGGTWRFNHHKLTGVNDQTYRMPTDEPVIADSMQTYEVLIDVLETALDWMAREGYEVADEM